MYTLLYLKWITSKDLLYNTGNSVNVLWQPGWAGKLRENEYMYIAPLYMYNGLSQLSPFAVHLKLSQHC